MPGWHCLSRQKKAPLPEMLLIRFVWTLRQLSASCLVYDQGWVTVQDLSAQRCALLLEPQNGESILDLCAAPGGKTTHILEIAPQADVLAVDIDEQRLARVRENLQRLGMQADVRQGDGRTPAQWCGDKQFDRILLDAPCSATGVNAAIRTSSGCDAIVISPSWASLQTGKS
ncbi:MAG: methyltransferase domain-containing protein [Polyangiaceae bacterium]